MIVADHLWFVIEKLRLDPRFNVPESDVMIKFEKASNNPTILIPKEVSIKPNAGISNDFIVSAMYIAGWKSVFPGIFLDVNGELIELIFSIAGILGNLSLFNLVSPKPIETGGNEIIAEFVDAAEQDDESDQGE